VIVKITTGKSFQGAAMYFLHDKRQPGEAERLSEARVAWTDAFNTLHADPERVIREMQATALNQSWLRQQSGHGKGGRLTEQCVIAISLSWHPEQQPDPEHMREAARDFLQRMGWGEHQVLLVAHNDTAHRHVHLLLNTIHPETGLTLDRNWSRLRAGTWRMEYERTHGQVYTRAPGEGGAAPAPHYGEWQAWREVQQEGRVDPQFQAAVKDGEWRTLKQHQREERLAFWKENARARRELKHAVRDEVKAEFAPAWHAYAEGRDQRCQEAQHYDREARRAVQHFRRFGPLHGVEAPRQIRERQRAYHDRQHEALASQRAALHAAQKQRSAELTAPALARLAEGRAALYQQLLKSHRDERAALAHDQAHGARRPDLLTATDGPTATVLTVAQIKAYKEHAIAHVAREQALQAARREIAPSPVADAAAQRAARAEQTDRKREARQSIDADTWRRAAEFARVLAQRREDAGRDGSGGREGGGRER
jgi:hypothetical protein